MVHIKHETSQLKMIHLSQIIQVRNPMKNMRKCLNSTKTLENNNYKICTIFSVYKNNKNSKTTKQKTEKNNKIETIYKYRKIDKIEYY